MPNQIMEKVEWQVHSIGLNLPRTGKETVLKWELRNNTILPLSQLTDKLFPSVGLPKELPFLNSNKTPNLLERNQPGYLPSSSSWHVSVLEGLFHNNTATKAINITQIDITQIDIAQIDITQIDTQGDFNDSQTCSIGSFRLSWSYVLSIFQIRFFCCNAAQGIGAIDAIALKIQYCSLQPLSITLVSIAFSQEISSLKMKAKLLTQIVLTRLILTRRMLAHRILAQKISVQRMLIGKMPTQKELSKKLMQSHLLGRSQQNVSWHSQFQSLTVLS